MKVAIFSNAAELSDSAMTRLDNIISLGADVLIGDHPVTDRLIQQYLSSKGHTKVVVHYAGSKPKATSGYLDKGGYVSTGVRDIEIAKLADYGLAIGTNTKIKKSIAIIGEAKTRLVAA